ncbi:hypothetical protein D0T49_09355 [Paludibacter sp. 221]|uniref:OmpP1/FadL family transporter n=1 Tax=Paludibacter sp. 221 TaxID=2302939 RepID=UPI0013D4BE85|nr:hypothetical protein [Paludibacter sp. 221]NDV47250.1 hypothetical protein [Paludibacter sp. 221]
MKKIKLALILSLSVVSIAMLKAQTTEFDAIKIAHQDISGTARYMGMAGAFGALGGDVSAIKDNPAGLGVYRSSEITTTFNFLTQTSHASWEGATASDDLFKLGFKNAALVGSFKTWNAQDGSNQGLLQSNWGFSYNRLKNFNRNTKIKSGELDDSMADYIAFFSNASAVRPSDFTNSSYFYDDFDNTELPWLTVLGYRSNLIEYDNRDEPSWYPFAGSTPSKAIYTSSERGYIDEYAFSWGGNFSNKLYLGATLNISSITYDLIRTYSETYASMAPDMQTGNKLSITGNGINLNVGLIFRPFNQLRIGLSYKTPTLYNLEGNVNNVYMDDVSEYGTTYNYELRTPGVANAGVAYIFGKRAILSTDLVYTNYKQAKIYNSFDGYNTYYEYNNENLKEIANHAFLVKVGGELLLTERVFLRAGFAAETAVVSDKKEDDTLIYKRMQYNSVRTDTEYSFHKGTNYITAGLGYRGNKWYIDAAFVNRNMKEEFYPYESDLFTPAKVTIRNYDVVATLGIKF